MPRELTPDQQRQAARDFAQKTARTRTDQPLPYTFAIHDKGDGNPHVHLMISERIYDGINRTRETWFARHDKARPDATGARKTEDLKPREWLENTRESWAVTGNQWLEKAGYMPRLDHRSNADRGIDRPPGLHVGPKAWNMEQKGIVTERGDAYRQRQAEQQAFDQAQAEAQAVAAELAALDAQIAAQAAEQARRDAALEAWADEVWAEFATPEPQAQAVDLEPQPDPLAEAVEPEPTPEPQALAVDTDPDPQAQDEPDPLQHIWEEMINAKAHPAQAAAVDVEPEPTPEPEAAALDVKEEKRLALLAAEHNRVDDLKAIVLRNDFDTQFIDRLHDEADFCESREAKRYIVSLQPERERERREKQHNRLVDYYETIKVDEEQKLPCSAGRDAQGRHICVGADNDNNVRSLILVDDKGKIQEEHGDPDFAEETGRIVQEHVKQLQQQQRKKGYLTQ